MCTVIHAVAAALVLLATGCAGDPTADPRIEAMYPAPPPNSVLYWETFQDGKWRWDQPPPEIQRRWLVDCAELDADAASIEQHFFDQDFVKVDEMMNGLNYLRKADGFTAAVWTSRNLDEFWANSNQFGLARDQVEGRCLVSVNIQDTEYSNR